MDRVLGVAVDPGARRSPAWSPSPRSAARAGVCVVRSARWRSVPRCSLLVIFSEPSRRSPAACRPTAGRGRASRWRIAARGRAGLPPPSRRTGERARGLARRAGAARPPGVVPRAAGSASTLPLTAYFACIPMILLIMLLPITINGIGHEPGRVPLVLRRGRRRPRRGVRAVGALRRPRHRRQPARRAAVPFWWRRRCHRRQVPRPSPRSHEASRIFWSIPTGGAVRSELDNPRLSPPWRSSRPRGVVRGLGFHLPKVLFPVEGRPLLELLGSRLRPRLAGSVTMVLQPRRRGRVAADAGHAADADDDRDSVRAHRHG